MRKLPPDIRKWSGPDRKMLVGFIWGLLWAEAKSDQVEATKEMKKDLETIFKKGVSLELREHVEVIEAWVNGTYGKRSD